MVAAGHEAAVRAQSNGIVVSCRNAHNIGPALHIALSVFVVPDSDNGTVAAQTDCMLLPRRDLNDPGPVFGIALPERIIAAGANACIRSQIDRVIITGVKLSERYFRALCGNIRRFLYGFGG